MLLSRGGHRRRSDDTSAKSTFGSFLGRSAPEDVAERPSAHQRSRYDDQREEAVEWTLYGVRVTVVAGMAVLLAAGPPSDRSYPLIGWVLVGIAGSYALAVMTRAARLPLWLSSALDLVLTLVGVGVTGSVQSPMIGVLFLVVASVTMRFDRRRGMAVAALATAGLAIVVFSVPRPAFPSKTDVVMIAGSGVLVVLEAILVGRLADIEGEAHVQIVREIALHESLVMLEGERRALLAAIMHDLRTPIAGAAGIARSLSNPLIVLNPDQSRHAVRVLSEHVTYINNLVGDIQQLVGTHQRGTLEEVSLRPIRLESLIRQAVQVAYNMMEGPGATSVTIAEDVPTVVMTDALKLQRIIVNLITNALEHAGPTSDVELAAHRAGETRLRIEVLDRGPGLSEEAMANLFSAPRSRPATVGTTPPASRGIGLWVVAELAAALGGSIQARKRPGGGMAAIVDLPLVPHHDGGRASEPDRADYPVA